MSNNALPRATVTCSGGCRHGRRAQATGRAADLFRWCCLLLSAVGLLAGCATVPRDYARTESTAFAGYLDTSVGQLFEETAQRHPGKSGFAIVRYGRQAFTARVALTELAEKSLDLQYYIWDPDATGRILGERL